MLSKGIGASFNIVTGELGPVVAGEIGNAYPRFGNFNPFTYLYSKLNNYVGKLDKKNAGKVVKVDGVELLFVDHMAVMVIDQ